MAYGDLSAQGSLESIHLSHRAKMNTGPAVNLAEHASSTCWQ